MRNALFHPWLAATLCALLPSLAAVGAVLIRLGWPVT